ncbi:hypothetical protein THAOC_18242 [Thalassiosira oceanica]|uniref:Uncharacterized protein n=1 Tax=Thalassiosira oceanica TaxID=159749 RepID=K0SSQ5_THAOC|nr:hypothetical protein THAOC_18242 [Thalassiosira oceanica]|eukprot:EJK61302.1 hypothetical protein THAOC_18242 [Thalassiosira oceanica]
MKKIFVPDRFGKWLYRRPSARGARDGPPGGPGRSARREMVEIPPHASVRNGPEAGKALGLRAAGSCGTNHRTSSTPVVGFGRKVASRKALVELYKSL